MKFFLALTIMMVSLGVANRTWAGTSSAATPPAAGTSAQNTASQLGTPAISTETMTSDRAQHLEQQSNEINQTLSEKGTNRSPSVGEMLHLPQGLVIRPTRRGLMVGTHF
ncbi:MAG TPA: hypothetical protein V6C57_17795 [Coleofasciculaceae cyanobacterium]